MTTRQWPRRAGDPNLFAFEVAFEPDPDGGLAIDADEGISWGSFQIWVEGKNLSAHQDEGEQFDSIHWYLLPLFEWLTDNWNALLHEERLPLENKKESAWESLRSTRFPPPAMEAQDDKAEHWQAQWQAWWTRHALCACRQGGLYPDVVFRRWRDQIEISWGPAKLAGTPDHFRFLESEHGSARVPPKIVANALFEVMDGGAEYLAGQAPNSERIRMLRERIARLKQADL